MMKMLKPRQNAYRFAALAVLLSVPFYASGVLPSAVTKTAPPVHFGPRLNVQLQKDGIETLLVLRVDFADQPGQRPRHEMDERLFNKNIASLASYMEEVSYGQMSIQPGPDGGSYPLNDAWYRAPKHMRYYGQGEVNAPRYRELTEDALDAALPDLRLSDFDRDGDGVLDHLVILHSGNDQAATAVEEDIWSVLLPGLRIERQGIRVEAALIVAEDPDREYPNVGIWCHEFMHNLGAPEMYVNRDFVAPNDNQFSLMGRSGPYQGDGVQPAHICGYLKWDIDGDPENGRSGWIEPIEIRSGGGLFEIGALSQPNGKPVLYKIDVPNTDGREFFLIENRSKGGRYDSALPDEGLLIWHIDEKIPLDSGWSVARRTWLEDPADPAHERLLDDANNILVTQDAAYAAEDRQTAFTRWTAPNSSGNGGEATGISIVGASESGRVMTFYAFFGETFEPNDMPSEAYPVPLNRTIHSEIQDGDVDHFRLNAPTGSQLLASASIPLRAPLTMSLLNANGQTVSSAVRAAGGESDQLQLRYFSQSAETLTLRIAPTGPLTETAPYQLTAQAETASGPIEFVSLRIYPNPAPRGVTIRAHASLSQAPIDRAEASVYDAQGSRAMRMELTGLSSADALFQFNNALAPGVYFMVISVEQNEHKLQRIGKFAVK